MQRQKIDNQNEIIISAKKKWYHWGVKEALSYKSLIGLFVRRDFKIQYKQTILGPLWLLLGPLITSLTYTFVFGQFAGISTDGVPHLLFYLAGVNMWTMFNTAVMNISNTFVSNSPIFGKVYFPRLTVPISLAFISIVNFFLQLVILLLFYVFYFFTGQIGFFSWDILLLPVVVLHCAILGFAIGLIVTSLTTKYRDLSIAVNYCMTLWMFATPIVYPFSSTGGFMRSVLLLNPMTSIINNFRFVLLGSGYFLLLPWLLSIAITIVLLVVGLSLYSKTERVFIDTI